MNVHIVAARAFAVGAAIALLLASAAQAATVHYASIDVPGADQTSATAINDAGTIIGWYNAGGTQHGFVQASNGTITSIDPAGSTTTQLAAINIHGAIAGTYQDNSGHYHGFIADSSGNVAAGPFDCPNGVITQSEAFNDYGTIVGYCEDLSNAVHMFIRDAAGPLSFVTFPSGDIFSNAVGITTSGEICGNLETGGILEGFVSSPPYTNFTTFAVPGAVGTQAEAIDNRGDVTGLATFDTGERYRGFERRPSGKIAVFAVRGSTSTWPLDINDKGVVVGYFNDSVGQHGFIRSIRHHRARIRTFNVNLTGAQSTGPSGINDSSDIVGSWSDATTGHGFLRTP